MPFSGNAGSASFGIQEKPSGPGDPGPHGDVRLVSPAYFQALKIALMQAVFLPKDREGSERVAIVDENLARQYWGSQSPIGQHIRGGARGGWAAIIG